MKKRKILILSLGTGNILGIEKDVKNLTIEEKQEKLVKKEFSYRKTTYYMVGEEEDGLIETEFVAEPLVKSFHPDEIFILGTSKSAWTGFYGKFGDGNTEIIQRLFDIEEQGGRHVRGDALKAFSNEVEEYYRKGICDTSFKKVKIHVLMLCYGIDEEELLENYDLLCSIEEKLDREQCYEIAFDITHSFRSLPLYNLVILNYLKSVSQIDLEISHVYYGNFEIANENDKKAPIVDLKELIGVLNLFGGNNEFKNTGNTASLLQYIPDTEKELRNALEKFDWATQVNLFDRVIEALKELLVITDQKKDKQDKFADLREMIANVIQIKFFGEKGEKRILLSDFEKMPVPEKQFLICNWYLRQNRYGQAVVTAMEALRSYLIPMYLKYKKIEINTENLEKEAYRKQAIDRLKMLCGKLKADNRTLGEVEVLFYELNQARNKATKVRNDFAHNLSEGNGKGEIGEKDYYKAKGIISYFIEKLGEFRSMVSTRRQEIERLYQKEFKVEKVRAERDITPVRIVIAPPNVQIAYQNYRRSNKKSYQVFGLAEKISQYLDRSKKDAETLLRSSLLLARYIEDLNFDFDSLQVIFIGLSLKQVIHYAVALQHQGVKLIFWEENESDPKEAARTGKLCQMPPLEFDINWGCYEELEPNEKEREWMGLDVIEKKN